MQVQSLNYHGFCVVMVTDKALEYDPGLFDKIANVQFQLIYTSPEIIIVKG